MGKERRSPYPFPRSVIALAQSLQMDVIAEGVETQAQVEYLRGQGCYKLQGYYFSRPIPAEDFARFWEQELQEKPSRNRKNERNCW